MNDRYPFRWTFIIFLNFQLYVFHNGVGWGEGTVTKGRKCNFLFCPTVPASGDILASGHSVPTLPLTWRVYGEPYGNHRALRVWGLAPESSKILTG